MSNDLGMGIEIQVDAGKAVPTLNDVEKGLAKVEAAGDRAKTAVTEFGKGAREGSSEAEKLKQSTQAAVNPFDGLTAAIKREQGMLDQIHGPAKRYAEDLQTLDSLLSKNRISTDEYASAVTRLNKAIGEKPEGGEGEGGAAEAYEGGLGVAGQIAAGGAAVETMNLFKEKIGEAIEASQRLADQYINLKNSTLGFKDAGISTDATVAEMNELNEELQSKLPETIDLYRRIDMAADHLGLTHEQTIAITKAFGTAALDSGHSMEDAASSMGRLSIAMQTGQLDARTLNSIIKTMPDITKVWQKAFGESTTQILHDIQSHKISIAQLMEATAKYGDVLDGSLKNREKTNEVQKEELNTGALLLQQRYNVTFQEAYFAQQLSESERMLRKNVDGTLKYTDAQDQFEKVLKQVNATVEEGKDKFSDAEEKLAAFSQGVVSDAHALGDLNDKFGNMLQTIGAMTDKWGNLDTKASKALAAIAVGQKAAAERGDARKQLDALDAALASGVRINDAYEQRRALLEKIGGEETKVYFQIVEPMHQYETHLKIIDDLLAHQAINAKQALDARLKLESAIGLKPAGALLDGSSFDTQQRFLAKHGGAAPELDVADASDAFELPKADEKAQRALELFKQTRTEAEKYKDQLQEINELAKEGYLNDEARARIQNDINGKWNTEQWHKGLEQYEKEAQKTGQAIMQAIEPLNKAFLDFLHTGKFSLDEFEKQLEEMLLKMAEMRLLEAAIPGSTKGQSLGGLATLLGFADGGSFRIPHAADGIRLTPMRSGRDDHLLQMFVRTGEDVTVRTEAQQRAAAQMAGGGPQIINHAPTVIVQDDPRRIQQHLDGPMGDAWYVRMARKHSGVLKAYSR